VRLEITPSKAFAAVILCLHLAAAACAALVVPGAAGAALGILLLALGAASAWQHALLRGARSQQAFEILASGEGRVILKNCELVPARPVGGIGISRYWVALRTGAGYRDLLVTRNMLSAGDFRLLRLWARWGRLPGVAPLQLRN
jgi:hypothetical protein